MTLVFTSEFHYGYWAISIYNRDYHNYLLLATVMQAKDCKSGFKQIGLYHEENFIGCLSEKEVDDTIVKLSSELKSQTLDYKIYRIVQRVCRNFEFFCHTPARLNKNSLIEITEEFLCDTLD